MSEANWFERQQKAIEDESIEQPNWVRRFMGLPPLPTKKDLLAQVERLRRIEDAVRLHHAQRVEDMCWMDDASLYEAAGLPPKDFSIGDPVAMKKNCDRFIDNRCRAGGPWKSYAELETELQSTKELLKQVSQIASAFVRMGMNPRFGPWEAVERDWLSIREEVSRATAP